MTVGIFPGKFLPLHRGHLAGILQAHTLVDRLVVLISWSSEDDDTCRGDGMERPISPVQRKQWLRQELQGFEGIDVCFVDETGIPPFPGGWADWSFRVRKAVGEPIDLIFGGEPEYAVSFRHFFPEAQYVMVDPHRSQWNISGTSIRKNPLRYWDFICGSARPFFVQKILVSGTESTGKTTLVKKLAKIFNTSWSEEVGRYYAQQHLGGDETIFTPMDFARMAHLQYEEDYKAMRTANRIVFFDTDAVVTNYYSELYLGARNPRVGSFIDPTRYDRTFLLTPSVPWVPDGQRIHGEEPERWRLHDMLRNMYQEYGFSHVVEVSGNYNERFTTVYNAVFDLYLP